MVANRGKPIQACVAALSGLVVDLFCETRPNNCYPNRYSREDKVTVEDDSDDVKEENGCPVATNMAQRGGPMVQRDSRQWEPGFKSDVGI